MQKDMTFRLALCQGQAEEAAAEQYAYRGTIFR